VFVFVCFKRACNAEKSLNGKGTLKKLEYTISVDFQSQSLTPTIWQKKNLIASNKKFISMPETPLLTATLLYISNHVGDKLSSLFRISKIT
jgi:hypothetical protein